MSAVYPQEPVKYVRKVIIMNIINVENITKSYTERELFHKASFYLQEGEKVGVIGINGTGKSTLLKIIAGLEQPEEGTVTRGNRIVVRYLPQNPVFDSEKTVLESVLLSAEEYSGAGELWNLESDANRGAFRRAEKTFSLSGSGACAL